LPFGNQSAIVNREYGNAMIGFVPARAFLQLKAAYMLRNSHTPLLDATVAILSIVESSVDM
jgi:hypothetical protein